MVPTHTQTYSTQLPFVTFLCLLSECVRSSGPVRADNSGVHRQLIAAGGHGERQGALALLGQLQRGRGRQQPCQRGRRRRRRSLREESADTIKEPKTHGVISCLLQSAESEPCALVPTVMAFLENHGKNIQLSNQNLTAARVSSYNQGLLVTAQPLARQQLFQVTLLHSDIFLMWSMWRMVVKQW